MNRKVSDPAPGSAILNIVVVDDSEDSAELLAELLRCDGHDVRVANLGRDALELLAQKRPDVVLLDVGLPDLDGYAVAQAIRARFGQKIRLVALTGLSGKEPRAHAMVAGFDAFLAKPCSVKDLTHALRPGEAEE